MHITEYGGLSDEQVLRSRQLHGGNVLPPPPSLPLWRQYLKKFTDPIIIILLLAGLLSVVAACYEYYYTGAGSLVFFSPAGIFLAVFLSTGLAFYFEQCANKEFTLLSCVNDDEPYIVIRNGKATTIAKRNLVVGDVVALPTGVEVPADGELLMAEGLVVDESSLTGEAFCHKTTVVADYDSAATYPSNHVLRGTKVMAGEGVLRVCAVGIATESGHLKQAAEREDSIQTPLNAQLGRLGAWMTNVGYCAAALIIVAKLLVFFHFCWQAWLLFIPTVLFCGIVIIAFRRIVRWLCAALLVLFAVVIGLLVLWIHGACLPLLPLATLATYTLRTFMIAVTIVVIVVPEGLPMAVTLSLAFSMRRMFKTNNLVRNLHACETMGAATVICTDKTGTLTETTLYDDATLRHDEVIREGVPAALRDCRQAGIAVKIVTGDTPQRARAVAVALGLLSEDDDRSILTGQEMAAMSDEALQECIENVVIVARARPMDKQRLVEALQKRGHIVAVTGDGTNDAPALKTAHVGVSMGAGTDVAKSASDITILDNSFVSICRAVMWGRSLYKNIQRFLLFQLTVNVTACLLVLVGTFMGTAAPLTITQMLWVNIIMDTFGAMALAALPPSWHVMRKPPRSSTAFVLTRDMLANICGVGVLFFAVLLALLYVFYHADITCLADLRHIQLGTRGSISFYERTLLFSLFVWLHFWYLFCARAYGTRRSIFTLRLNRAFLTIVVLIILGQLVIVEGAYNFFDVVPLLHNTSTAGGGVNIQGVRDFLTIIILSSAVLWVREVWCMIKRVCTHE